MGNLYLHEYGSEIFGPMLVASVSRGSFQFLLQHLFLKGLTSQDLYEIDYMKEFHRFHVVFLVKYILLYYANCSYLPPIFVFIYTISHLPLLHQLPIMSIIVS